MQNIWERFPSRMETKSVRFGPLKGYACNVWKTGLCGLSPFSVTLHQAPDRSVFFSYLTGEIGAVSCIRRREGELW